MDRWLLIGICVLSGTMLTAQSAYFPAGHPSENAILKYNLHTDNSTLHSAIRPYRRDLADQMLGHLSDRTVERSASLRALKLWNNEWQQYPERPDTARPFVPASERPVLKWFYRTPAHFLEIYKEDFYLQLDPILHLEGGRLEDHKGLLWNRRGFNLTGGIDGKVGFYADVVESQVRFPPYVNRWVSEYGAIPGQGLFKEYNSDVFDVRGGYDFLNSRAHVAFPLTEHINTQFGYGRHFFGHGQRSLLLSDFANNYAYAAINTNIWKLHYKNIFAQLHATSPEDTEPNVLLPKKYLAAHYLSFKGLDKLEVGIYEAVVFSRDNGFEWTYLIPVILYRTVEQGLGSPDNVILGINLAYSPFDKLRLYGQVVFDEFVFREWFGDNRNWWGNKAGIQLGIQYYDALGLKGWDAQLEWNTVRPYTYTHRDSSSNYVHYNQPLAHPLGANFSEIIFELGGEIKGNWTISGYLVRQRFGGDSEGENFGSNILKFSDTRVRNYGVEMFQGIDTKRLIVGGELGYSIFPGAYLETTLQYRNTDPVPENVLGSTWYWTLGFRMNIARNNYWF